MYLKLRASSLLLLTSLFLGSPSVVFATNYYVSPTGSDSNSGLSTSTPFKTFAKSVSNLKPGDTLYLNGTFNETLNLGNKRGVAGSPITIANYPGSNPIIDGQGSRATMVMPGASYIVINGLTLANSSSYALYSDGSSNISVINSEVDHPLDGGLVFRNGTNILVDNSNVHHTNWRGDGSHEAISMVKVNGFEVKNSQVHDSKEEGIDAKYGSANGKIHHNRVYANAGPNVYVDAASSIEIFNNEIYGATADKANIGLAVEYHDNKYTTENITIYNNIIRESPGGVSFWIEGSASSYAKISNVNIYHNLFYANTGRGAIRLGGFVNSSSNIKIKNNIFWTFNSDSIDEVSIANTDYNIFNKNPKGSHSFTTTNPGFANESQKDFHLLANSPAVNAGINIGVIKDFDGNARPQGPAIDIGPYELASSTTTSPIPTPKPWTTLEADYSTWLSHYLQSIIGFGNGDFSGDGRVNGVDYVLWLNNYGL